jgi:hypothetical protein
VTHKEFEEQVREFYGVVGEEYARESSFRVYEEDDGELGAEIILEDFSGEKWVVPIKVDPAFDVAGIYLGDAGYMCLTSGSFYCYLWHEARERLRAEKTDQNVLDARV